MSNPAPDFEEMAALHALGLLDEAGTAQLLDTAERDPQVRRLVDAFGETAAQVALEAPEVTPPPGLRQDIMNNLPARHAKVLQFSQWFPFAVAACLMILGIGQTVQIFRMNAAMEAMRERLNASGAEVARLRDSTALMNLRLALLDAKDPTYASSKVMVAWDPYQHIGTLAMQDLPTPPAGHDYQLWVLDPNAPSPISACIISTSRPFAVKPVSVQNPGFAVSLEPSGGSPSPTGPILFAVAPAQ